MDGNVGAENFEVEAIAVEGDDVRVRLELADERFGILLEPAAELVIFVPGDGDGHAESPNIAPAALDFVREAERFDIQINFAIKKAGRGGFSFCLVRVALVKIAFALAAGVIEIDDLQIGVEIDGRVAHFARADAAIFRAAKRYMCFAADRWRIYVRHACLDLVDKFKNLVGIGRVDGARKAVAHGIRGRQGLVETLHADHAEHRPEDFLLRDAALDRDAVEHRRRDEPTAIEARASKAVAAANELRFLPADFDVAQNGFQLRFVHERAHVDAGLEAIAHHVVPRALGEPLHEFVRDFFLDDHAARGRA